MICTVILNALFPIAHRVALCPAVPGRDKGPRRSAAAAPPATTQVRPTTSIYLLAVAVTVHSEALKEIHFTHLASSRPL